MASRRYRRIEPTFDEPSGDSAAFSVREEDRVVPASRKQQHRRKPTARKKSVRGKPRRRRGLLGLFGRFIYWGFVLAIWAELLRQASLSITVPRCRRRRHGKSLSGPPISRSSRSTGI